MYIVFSNNQRKFLFFCVFAKIQKKHPKNLRYFLLS